MIKINTKPNPKTLVAIFLVIADLLYYYFLSNNINKPHTGPCIDICLEGMQDTKYIGDGISFFCLIFTIYFLCVYIPAIVQDFKNQGPMFHSTQFNVLLKLNIFLLFLGVPILFSMF